MREIRTSGSEGGVAGNWACHPYPYHRETYDELTLQVEAARAKRRALLESVSLPLPGLTVDAGELLYNGQRWDGMSGMEQIRVAAAIIRRRKPECGFILLDKMEAFDLEQLQALSAWLQAENLQAIATRVSTGDECSIIIEDGALQASADFNGTASAAAATTFSDGSLEGELDF